MTAIEEPRVEKTPISDKLPLPKIEQGGGRRPERAKYPSRPAARISWLRQVEPLKEGFACPDSRTKKGKWQEAEAGRGGRETTAVPLRLSSRPMRTMSRKPRDGFLLPFLRNLLGAPYISWDRLGRKEKREP